MSTIKTALKAAKASLDAQKYDEAVEHANKVLATDPQNYHAYVLSEQCHQRFTRETDACPQLAMYS